MTSNSPAPLDSVRLSSAAVALVMLAVLWLYAIGWALNGYPIYRDQHLGTAVKYANEGDDLLHLVIMGFNATRTGTPQEFPVWQILAGLALRLIEGWWGRATIASLSPQYHA